MIWICCFLLVWGNLAFGAKFVENWDKLSDKWNRQNAVVVASPGRSGSTLLTEALEKCKGLVVLKTHLLPPGKRFFRGKILFIFSDPDRAAESAFHRSFVCKEFGFDHFKFVETANRNWLAAIGDTTRQTIEHNLLAQDALGIYTHLAEWLYARTRHSISERAEILAIKYENLWDEETIAAIEDFLSIDSLELPARQDRRGISKFSEKEKAIREYYNWGTEEEPRYFAYDGARWCWMKSPPFLFLELKY